jgi:hypothetical protein
MHFHFVHISKYSRGNLFKTNLIFAAQTLNLHKSKARKQLDMAASLSFFLLFFLPWQVSHLNQTYTQKKLKKVSDTRFLV